MMVGLMFLRPTGGGFVMAQCLGVWMRVCFVVLLQQGLANVGVGECLGGGRVTVCEGAETLRSGCVLCANRSK